MADFRLKNALSREESARHDHLGCTAAIFEEGEKGSLEKGKVADFIVIDRDLLKVDKGDILSTKVLKPLSMVKGL